MKNRTRMLNKILEFSTYRVVQRCFTWSAILAPIQTFSNRQYIYSSKNHRKSFITVLTWENDLSEPGNIVLTVWFNNISLFSISTAFWAISGYFDIYLLFCDETVWMYMIHQPWCMNFIAGVENGSDRWISTMKFKGTNHDGLPQCLVHSLERASHKHSDHNTEKKNEKLYKYWWTICIQTVSSKNNEKYRNQ